MSSHGDSFNAKKEGSGQEKKIGNPALDSLSVRFIVEKVTRNKRMKKNNNKNWMSLKDI